MVEKCNAIVCLLHHPTLVDDVVDMLRFLFFVDVDHQLVATGSSLPVYVAVFVVWRIVPYLGKVGVVACSTGLFHSIYVGIVSEEGDFKFVQLEI